MSISVVYWSGTGNTQAMAEAIAAGAQAKGAEVVVSEADSFDTATLGDYDSIAFGSPAMGAEELEDSVESLFSSIEGDLSGKTVSLFGPYYEVDESDYYQDLLLYLAGALVFLLLLEWYLQHKESSI